MNRQETAAELILELGRLIVGHPSKLKSRSRQFGTGMVLYLQAVKSDTGRLIGPSGTIHKSLKELGCEIALAEFDLLVEEPNEDARSVTHKLWAGEKARHILDRVLVTIFNGDFKMVWRPDGASDLVEIELGSGFDQDRTERVSESLKVIFNAVGRAHNRVIKIWLAEAVKK